MKAELQGKNECMLATLAALKGVSLDSVRKRACQIACTIQWDAVPNNGCYINYFGKYMSHFRFTISILAEEMGINSTYLWNDDQPIDPQSQTVFLPETGKGVINIEIIYSTGRKSAHISPFENGRIYDTGAWDKPTAIITGETLEEYITRWSQNDSIVKIYNIRVIA